MGDQPISIVEYDLSWPDQFAEQALPVSAVLAWWLDGRVEHVGSTAVPGLAAKPVVDMLAPVRSLADARGAVPMLETAGWLFWPDDPGRGYRLWFLRPRPEARTHHLYLIEHGDVHAIALVAFRDALRGDEKLRREYATLKRELAGQYEGNRNAYTNAKADFVERVLRSRGIDPPSRNELSE